VVNRSSAAAGPGRPRRLRTQLSDAVVLVTGAGSGIGLATSLAFARAGAHVVAVDIDLAAAEKAAGVCAEADGTAEARRCDVSDWAAVSALADELHATHGALDVVVNNAGVGMTGRFADMTIDDWRWIRSINLDGVVHGCRAFAPPMLERGSGQIVNVSSGLGYTMRATEPAYVTTKAAVLALSQCLRADWSRRGVGVSAICPGVINTPIVESTRYVGEQDAPATRARARKLFKRGHSPDLVARAIVDAVQRDRAVVPVGWEAKVGWRLRAAPVGATQAIARRGMP
jgi:NAD(P)-dependent dehydrogenase (short-subunit alcohol dehydrogenase family)